MRRIAVALAALAMCVAVPSGASAARGAPSVYVHSNATIVMHLGSGSFVNFEFVVQDCPPGTLMTFTWEAEQPEPGHLGGGEGTYISGPDSTQRFILTIQTVFAPGYRWVGSGVVTCGPVVIPVTGSGGTKVVS